MKRRSLFRSQSGMTLVELLISSGINILLTMGLMVGVMTLQRSFRACRHHVESQTEQIRLVDYMSLDLRRALTVSTVNGMLSLTVPDYYDSSGNARDPVISGGQVHYGATGSSVNISYYRQGNSIYRNVGGKVTPIATEVQDFNLFFTDNGQVISASITFVPKFMISGREDDAIRNATVVSCSTLLRNKRLN